MRTHPLENSPYLQVSLKVEEGIEDGVGGLGGEEARGDDLPTAVSTKGSTETETETETESLAINADRAMGHFVVDLNGHQGQGERVDKDFRLTTRTNRGTYAAYLLGR